jgi:hypothetical protein
MFPHDATAAKDCKPNLTRRAFAGRAIATSTFDRSERNATALCCGLAEH